MRHYVNYPLKPWIRALQLLRGHGPSPHASSTRGGHRGGGVAARGAGGAAQHRGLPPSLDGGICGWEYLIAHAFVRSLPVDPADSSSHAVPTGQRLLPTSPSSSRAAPPVTSGHVKSAQVKSAQVESGSSHVAPRVAPSACAVAFGKLRLMLAPLDDNRTSCCEIVGADEGWATHKRGKPLPQLSGNVLLSVF